MKTTSPYAFTDRDKNIFLGFKYSANCPIFRFKIPILPVIWLFVRPKKPARPLGRLPSSMAAIWMRRWVLATYLLGEHRMRSLLEPPNKRYPTYTPLVLITSGKNRYYNSIWHYEHPSRLYLTPHNKYISRMWRRNLSGTEACISAFISRYFSVVIHYLVFPFLF